VELMLREIVEKLVLNESVKVFKIKNIGSDKILKLTDECGDAFDENAFVNMVNAFQDDIGNKLSKKGENTIGIVIDENSVKVWAGYVEFKVESAEIFDAEGESRDATDEELKQFITYLETCKYFSVEYDDYGECKIDYTNQALNCYPKYKF
jgi:hypothetical protein